MSRLLKRARIPVLLSSLLVVALTGGLYLYGQFERLRNNRDLYDFFHMRQAFIGYVEAQKLFDILHDAGHAWSLSDRDRALLAQRVDFMQLRLDEIARSSPQQPDEQQSAFIATYTRMIALVSSALRGEVVDVRRLEQEVSALKGRFDRNTIKLANQRFAAERDFLAENQKFFSEILYGAIAIFALFVSIGAIAILLLRREIKARDKIAEAEERSRFLAYHDVLTGAFNRRSFNQRLEQSLERGAPVAVALIDLDDFKSINDKHGHDAGDALLRELARRMGRVVEAHGGGFARLGGDEFAALLPLANRDHEPVDRLCEDILDIAQQPIVACGVELYATFSIGCASSHQLSDLTPATSGRLLKAADQALYNAKANGKNRCARFSRRLEDELLQEQELERDLERAIANDELFFVFQPQIDMASGAVTGFETLARWRNRGELVPPGVFIAAAERTGQVRDIDFRALQASARAISMLRAEGLTPPRVSVNLSPLNFQNAAIVERVAQVLERYDTPPELLCIEITENVVLEDYERTILVLKSLKNLGVSLALDDFGAGYSSIGQLRKLDVDELKIDCSLTSGVAEDPETSALLSAMVELAQALKVRLVVEGVETQEQQARLMQLGYRVAQGFLFARPLEFEAARAMLIERAARAAAGANAGLKLVSN